MLLNHEPQLSDSPVMSFWKCKDTIIFSSQHNFFHIFSPCVTLLHTLPSFLFPLKTISQSSLKNFPSVFFIQICRLAKRHIRTLTPSPLHSKRMDTQCAKMISRNRWAHFFSGIQVCKSVVISRWFFFPNCKKSHFLPHLVWLSHCPIVRLSEVCTHWYAF